MVSHASVGLKNGQKNELKLYWILVSIMIRNLEFRLKLAVKGF